MANNEQVIKVVLTPAGSEWSAEREYERLDYISNGKEVWVSIKVDAATGKNVGHPLTDTAWWNKCIDLSEAESLAAAATVAANAAATTANKAAQAAMDAKTAAEAAVREATKATKAANTATSAARVATTAANDATAAAEKVNAVLGDDNILKVTDRTGTEKSLELVSQAAATEMAKQVEQNTAEIAELKENVKDYYVAENDEVTGDPKFKNGTGNKDILGDWHPFLIDHTDNAGEATHPVGQLMDNNHFRFVTGAFAPTVGITEEMRAACDVQLYTDAEHTQMLTLKNGVVVTDKAGAHPYDAAEVYNSLGLVNLYDGEGNKVRQLLPWETTETKYSVMIGRYDTLYPVDRQEGESGKVLSGVFKRPMKYDGINTGKYPLLGTALAPCPVTTVGGKTRNFFFAYAVKDSNTMNGPSAYGEEMCAIYVNDGRTYPRTSDVSQITDMKFARANNTDPKNPLPFASYSVSSAMPNSVAHDAAIWLSIHCSLGRYRLMKYEKFCFSILALQPNGVDWLNER